MPRIPNSEPRVPRSDPRHQPLMAEIDMLYRRHNGGLPAPDMGRTAKALHEFLRANPKWPERLIKRAMRNRFASDEVNVSESPWAWIRSVAAYVHEPLTKFGAQKRRGSGDIEFRYWEGEIARLGERVADEEFCEEIGEGRTLG